MMLPTLSEKDLGPYFSKEELIRQTAVQLQKDVESLGEGLEFSRFPVSYDELYTCSLPLIRKLSLTRQEKLFQLLYRIDVSEEQVAEAITSGGEISERITRLILLRELQKVVIRTFYSK
jgi:hypothetical protein